MACSSYRISMIGIMRYLLSIRQAFASGRLYLIKDSFSVARLPPRSSSAR